MRRLLCISRFLVLMLAGAFHCLAQTGADGRSSIYTGEDKSARPKSFNEMLHKLRIEKEKKEFDQMIARGEEAIRISTELEVAFEESGRLSEREMDKVEAVEKLVKKIRGELGGDDDDGEKESKSLSPTRLSAGDAIKSLKSTTVELFEELKKTSRFTISAAAIQASNAVIKIARFLRISK